MVWSLERACNERSAAHAAPGCAWRAAATLALVLLATAGGGCGPDPDNGDGSEAGSPDVAGSPAQDAAAAEGCEDCPRPSPFELGTGVTRFEPLPPEGGRLELTRGPQGGFHVYGAVRLWVERPDGAELRYRVLDASSGAELTFLRRARLRERGLLREGNAWVRLGDLLIFMARDPAEVAGTEAIVEATLRLADGSGPWVETRRVLLVDEVP